MRIVVQYIDRALSGTSDNRPQFQRMISDSASGAFEAIIVYKLDRFARNRYDSALYKKKLRDNGMKVISATEAISDSPEGIIMEGLLEAMDEYYSAELARKMRRGTEESFRKGKYINSVPPFGYALDDAHRLRIDQERAPIVEEIFKRYLDGTKTREIAEWLNSAGIANRAGSSWKIMDISRLLRLSVYKGEYRYGLEHFQVTLSRMVDVSGTVLINTIVNQIFLNGETVIICINLTDERNTPPLEQILFRVSWSGAKIYRS